MDFQEILHLDKLEKVGIMGGTFDPIHQGHLVTAETARCEFSLDKVVFVPAGKPPHKKDVKISDVEHRYLMTVLATSANPYFEVSRTEIDRNGDSYAIDTVRYIKSKMSAQAELFFITGADAILEILTWKDVQELLNSCTFIAATRPGYGLEPLKGKLAQELGPKYAEKILTLEVPAMAISSTDIRERVSTGRSIKYLLPESVERFIIKNDLYQK